MTKSQSAHRNCMAIEDPETLNTLASSLALLHSQPSPPTVLPLFTAITTARSRLVPFLSPTGTGLQETIRHLRDDLAPGFNANSRSPLYYGLVTGGATPAAALADNLVTIYDQNVSVHLPNETIATDVENRTLTLLCELLDLEPEAWPHRTFTTGATASNVLGLACGREYAIKGESVSELGIVTAMKRAEIDDIQILTTTPHSSLAKAASVLGLGRASVRAIGLKDAPHKFDIPLLESLLVQPRTASIIAVSAAEVNTGFFATSGEAEMRTLRSLADRYRAWIHVDAAFGIFARVLSSPSSSSLPTTSSPTSSPYTHLLAGVSGIHLADSLTGDCHKLLNVPYDCGFFLSRHSSFSSHIFQNPNAAYLSASTTNDANNMPSPLNMGLENSRRFRALPVYASLVAYGREGYKTMLERQIEVARGIARVVASIGEFELLPQSGTPLDDVLAQVFIIVLFHAKDEALNEALVAKIKATRRIYVSGTEWEGRPACRFAVANWMADVDKDVPIVEEVLRSVVEDWRKEQ